MAWHTELAYNENVKRRIQRAGDFQPHRHTPARQRQNQYVRLVAKGREGVSEGLPGMSAIVKYHAQLPFPACAKAFIQLARMAVEKRRAAALHPLAVHPSGVSGTIVQTVLNTF
ncbi:hypothetical protein GCM10010975_08490 [Comamonas phosphati]|nr:hypothetical protein GCM10010975_08490 [Comamonas phosphati]